MPKVTGALAPAGITVARDVFAGDPQALGSLPALSIVLVVALSVCTRRPRLQLRSKPALPVQFYRNLKSLKILEHEITSYSLFKMPAHPGLFEAFPSRTSSGYAGTAILSVAKVANIQSRWRWRPSPTRCTQPTRPRSATRRRRSPSRCRCTCATP